MENYYNDERVLSTLEKSVELMNILTFVKEVDFEIKDNLGFDVLWDSLSGKRYTYIGISLLKWMGYEGIDFKIKQNFVDLLDRNDIEYREIGYKDPLIQQFPDIQKEVDTMRPVDRPRKRWIIMESKNFKKAIMKLNTKRRDDIQDYYLLLEELVQLYGGYTTQFKVNQEKKKNNEKFRF